MERLNQDFLEFVELLERNRVRYLIVGGYAVGLHGFPRYTGDIDFFVAISEQNAERIADVFKQFGFGDIGLEELLKNKKASGRAKDLIDLAELQRIQRDKD